MRKSSKILDYRKEKCIDGTINKDGPAGYRKLKVLKPESKLINVRSIRNRVGYEARSTNISAQQATLISYGKVNQSRKSKLQNTIKRVDKCRRKCEK